MYANENATLDGRILDCIIQKIDDGLTKNQAIGGNKQITVSFHVYLLPFLLRQNFESGSRLLGNGKERSVSAMKLYVTGIRTRKNQQALNEARETVYFSSMLPITSRYSAGPLGS